MQCEMQLQGAIFIIHTIASFSLLLLLFCLKGQLKGTYNIIIRFCH